MCIYIFHTFSLYHFSTWLLLSWSRYCILVLSWASHLSLVLFVKFSVMKLTGVLVCSFFMELLFCKCVRIRITWICWLHYIFIPILVSFAPAKWASTRLHSLVGCQYIYFQYSFFIPERETWKGNFNSNECFFS